MAPFAIGTAVFFTEAAPQWLVRIMQPLIEIFTGIPSVVVGFLGLLVIVPLLQKLSAPLTGNLPTGGYGWGAAILVLVIMVLPTTMSISYDSAIDVISLRQRIGMVFQRANPFRKSIFDNVAYGLHIQRKSREAIQETVERSLREAALWDEVKDRLKTSAMGLSGGQQQRLCIARALAVRPEVLLMDEPCSALDPIATLKIEELITDLSKEYTIVIVTHNMQQAARVSQYTGFFLVGKLIEYAQTVDIFERPKRKETEDYVSGRFG